MIFTTSRLSVRLAESTQHDIDFFYRLWTTPEVTRYVGFPKGIPVTKEDIQQQIEHESDDEFNRLLIVERKEDGKRIGECRLGRPDKDGISETDVKLLPEFWGNKYGIEIKVGLLNYLFTYTSCKAVQASPNVHNEASIKMQEAVGGKRVDQGIMVFPKEMQDITISVEFYIYRVSREDWERTKLNTTIM